MLNSYSSSSFGRRKYRFLAKLLILCGVAQASWSVHAAREAGLIVRWCVKRQVIVMVDDDNTIFEVPID